MRKHTILFLAAMAAWAELAERSPFVRVDGVLAQRGEEPEGPGAKDR